MAWETGRREKIFRRDRFRQKRVHLLGLGVLRIEPTQQNYRQMSEVLAIPHKPAQLVTAQVRHHRIRNNHVDIHGQ